MLPSPSSLDPSPITSVRLKLHAIPISADVQLVVLSISHVSADQEVSSLWHVESAICSKPFANTTVWVLNTLPQPLSAVDSLTRPPN